MRMVKICLVLMLGVGFILVSNSTLYADETSEAILRLLIKKGIISQAEVDELKAEIAKEEPKVPETVEERVVYLEQRQRKLPDWVEKLKLKGDFRLRYQWEDKTDAEDQHRGRYRFRLGLETKVNKLTKVAVGLATGGSDPRSTNQTMGNTFDTPDIRLDYAYAEYAPTPWLTLKGGKIKGIKSLIFRPSDLLWDSDINPEGGSIQLSTSVNDWDLFMNNGVWVLDESSSDESDPFMVAVQPGFKYKFGDAYLKTAVAGYFFNGVKESALDHSAGTNTLDEDGQLQFDYHSVSPSLELGIKNPFTGLVPFAAVFGDYIYNTDSEAGEDIGYLAGLKFGDKKVKGKSDWQFKYMYRHLERDAWLDTFPDSDALSGRTDVEGHEVIFGYGLSKNSSLGLDYYFMERIKGTGRRHLLQADWKLKF